MYECLGNTHVNSSFIDIFIIFSGKFRTQTHWITSTWNGCYFNWLQIVFQVVLIVYSQQCWWPRKAWVGLVFILYVGADVWHPCRVPTASACRPNPCQNGGQCIRDRSRDTAHCNCTNGFTGKFCQMGKLRSSVCRLSQDLLMTNSTCSKAKKATLAMFILCSCCVGRVLWTTI